VQEYSIELSPYVYTCPRKRTKTFQKNPRKSKENPASFVEPTWDQEPILSKSLTKWIASHLRVHKKDNNTSKDW
jgi:hypothetical protein